MESQFAQALQWMRLIREAAAALWIGLLFVYAFAALVMAHGRWPVVFRPIRLAVKRPEAPLHVTPRPAQA
jgi:hypothetical protein